MTGTTPTPADRPADQLRAAAEKLRALLADLGDCRGPWYVVNREQRPYPQRIDNIGVPYVVASTTTDPGHPPTIADYICAMHPGVSLAVARWLESWAGLDLSEHGPMPEDAQHALAVARQLLGTSAVAAEPGCAMPGFMGCDCDHITGCQHPAAPPAPADRAAFEALAAEWERRGEYGDSSITDRARELRAVLAADAAAGVQQPTSEADTVLAAAIPEWEAVYEPGNVSDYLIGYANSEAAAKGAAIAWVLSQSDKTADRLEWDPQNWNDRHDAWFDLFERNDDGIDTGVGVTVRHRLHPYTASDFAPEADEEPAAPAAPEETQ